MNKEEINLMKTEHQGQPKLADLSNPVKYMEERKKITKVIEEKKRRALLNNYI